MHISVKPDVGVIIVIKTRNWQFKRGLMVPGGLSFYKIKPPMLVWKVQI